MLGEVQAAPGQLEGEAGRARGNALLEQVFGTRDTSRAVAARAASASGIGEGVIKAMLPYIIQMVMGAFARRTSGGLGDILSKIPNLGGGAPLPSGQGGGKLPGPEGMGSPGRNPYGDLSDIIRRGGRGTSVRGNPLWRVVRNVLGGALGFQRRGLFSWIVRMVVMRYGWTVLRRILQRSVTGR